MGEWAWSFLVLEKATELGGLRGPDAHREPRFFLVHSFEEEGLALFILDHHQLSKFDFMHDGYPSRVMGIENGCVFREVLDSWMGAIGLEYFKSGELVRISLPFPGRIPPHALGKRPQGAPSAHGVRNWLDQFMAGKGPDFPGAWRMPGSTPFTQRVYQLVALIPVGRGLSYQEVAIRSGSPRGARAVGNAMNQNPMPLLVPCHRVLASGGGLGGFAGGVGIKKRLLEAESFEF